MNLLRVYQVSPETVTATLGCQENGAVAASLD